MAHQIGNANRSARAKASISGTGIISRPVPRSTTTCVLSVQQQSFGCAHRVERPFWFIENNFLAGRAFASWEDLNQQARQWCDRVNATYKKYIRAVPRELFAVERLHLKPLPAWIPEVYRLHQRTVDVEGYVSVNSIRYSVPVSWIGRRMEVRETRDKVEIELDASQGARCRGRFTQD